MEVKYMYYGQVYMIRNTTNNRVYIGQTTKKYLSQRVGRFKRHPKQLQEDCDILGFDKFEIKTLLFVYDRFSLDYFEKYYIKLYRTNTYNSDVGGLYGNHTDKDIQVRCENCGKLYSNNRRVRNKLGLQFCSNTCSRDYYKRNNLLKHNSIVLFCHHCGNCYIVPKCKKNSKYCSKTCKSLDERTSFRGSNNPNYGSNKQRGSKNGRAKKCICLETGEIFNYAREADLRYGFRIGSVSSVCRGDVKSTHGLHFAYC